MEQSSTTSRTISRETRLLLVTILLSLCALLVLGRLRFPERAVTANPVGPILTQLVSPTSFEGLAASVSLLESRLAPLLITVALAPEVGIGEGRVARRAAAALRLRGDVAVGLTASRDVSVAQATPDVTVLARDPVSGLTVFRVPAGLDPTLAIWVPRRPQAARYLVAADVSRDWPSMRPVFVGGLAAATNPAWPGAIWVMPGRTDADAGTLLFTVEGELAGLVVEHDGERAIVPGDVLRAAVDRLQQQDASRDPGSLGLEVQALTPPIAAALGAGSGSGGLGMPIGGVVVAWVDPRGPAAGHVGVGDLLEGFVEAATVAPLTPSQWAVRADRLSKGDGVTLRVRSAADPGRSVDVNLTAGPLPPPAPGALGLTLRAAQRVGAAVVSVAPGSVAERSGLRPGDMITLAGAQRAPTPAQVVRAFAAATADRPLLVAVTRGTEHRVLALEPR